MEAIVRNMKTLISFRDVCHFPEAETCSATCMSTETPVLIGGGDGLKSRKGQPKLLLRPIKKIDAGCPLQSPPTQRDNFPGTVFGMTHQHAELKKFRVDPPTHGFPSHLGCRQ